MVTVLKMNTSVSVDHVLLGFERYIHGSVYSMFTEFYYVIKTLQPKSPKKHVTFMCFCSGVCFSVRCAADKCMFIPQIREDNKRQHPCLVDFSKLPETERSYNIQMSTETLK